MRVFQTCYHAARRSDTLSIVRKSRRVTLARARWYARDSRPNKDEARKKPATLLDSLGTALK
jgi:hypothetical protein